MKKNFTLAVMAIVIMFGSARAQLINQGFETWTPDMAVPSAMNPNSGNGTTGWWDFNLYNYSVLGSSPISVMRSDTAHGGTYSARIQTVVYTSTSYNIYSSSGVPYIGHNYSDTLGILFNGNVNETGGTYVPGFPCTQRLTSFSFWYLYHPNGVDTAECRVSVVKNRSLVGGGQVKIHTGTGMTWTQATVNFTYLDTLTPDTMYILFSASSLDRMPKPGSVFWVDDASVTLPAGIYEYSNSNNIALFPNPATGNVNLKITNPLLSREGGLVSVYNALGEVVYSGQVHDSQTTLDLSGASPGVYYVQFKTAEGTSTRKLILNN